MSHVQQLVSAATPTYETVGPGVGGFVAIFAIALATVLLIRSMVGHLRKVRYGPGPDAEQLGPGTPAGPDPAGAPAEPPEAREGEDAERRERS